MNLWIVSYLEMSLQIKISNRNNYYLHVKCGIFLCSVRGKVIYFKGISWRSIEKTECCGSTLCSIRKSHSLTMTFIREISLKMAWSRVYNVGIGLLKLSKLSGGSSWMGDHLATLIRPCACCHVTGREIVYWKGEHYSLPNRGKKQAGKVYILTWHCKKS